MSFFVINDKNHNTYRFFMCYFIYFCAIYSVMMVLKYWSFILGLLLINQCSDNHITKKSYRQIRDLEGREVAVPHKVEKIIAVNAGAMRFMSYMGAIPNIIGVEDKEHRARRPYNLAFPEIKNIPIIGPQHGGDAELMIKANPDVIFWSGYATSKGSAEELQNKIGIPVITIKSGELGVENDKIYETLRVIGKTLKKEKRAEELITYMEGSMKELRSRVEDIEEHKKPSVYVGGLSFNGSRGLASTRINFAPFQLVNAKNVIAELGYGADYTKPITIDLEKLIEWNPDYIFIDADGWILAEKEIQKNRELYQNLKAFKNGNVHIIPRYINNSTSYDYALIDAWYIAKILYPEQFRDIDMTQKSVEILEKFYDKKINLKDFDVSFQNLKSW